MTRSHSCSGRHLAPRRWSTAALVAVLAAGCSGGSHTEALDKVTCQVTRRLSSIVAHIAEAEGFFADEGLDVELVVWDRGSAVIPSLAHGDIDVSATGRAIAAHLNVIQRGARIRLVAARTVNDPARCPYFAFVARSVLIDSGRLSDIGSLRGLRIDTDRTQSSSYYWSRLLTMGGLTFADVELVEIPGSALPDAIAKGLVDVCSPSEPVTSRIVRSGHGRLWFAHSDVLPGHQSTFLVFGRRLLDERRDLGRRFLAAYMRAARQYVAEGKSERHIEIAARQTKIAADDLRQMCWPSWSADGRIDARSLEEFQAWALEQGLIDTIVPMSELVDESFLAAVTGRER